jgi:hypothetical protein
MFSITWTMIARTDFTATVKKWAFCRCFYLTNLILLTEEEELERKKPTKGSKRLAADSPKKSKADFFKKFKRDVVKPASKFDDTAVGFAQHSLSHFYLNLFHPTEVHN